MKHLLKMSDLTPGEVTHILDVADQLKAQQKAGGTPPLLAGKSVALMFSKNSTRTRVSFETGMFQLGGHALFLSGKESQIGRGEPVEDTARVLSRYCDGIMIRTYAQKEVEDLAKYASIPVINAGDGGHNHPTQTLADLLTISREMGRLDNLTIGLCGDLKYGRTVHSLIEAMSRYKGIQFVLISPEELKIPGFIRYNVFENQGIPYTEVSSLEEAMPKLDVLYMTRIQRERFDDPWEYERLKDSYVLDTEKMKLAKGKMCVLHPLPRVNEISVKVDDDPRAAYFRQALNGKYMRMALILKLLDEAARNPAKEAIDTTGLEYDRVCRNPKCITQTEQELPQLFRCTDKAADIHRCIYCEQRA